MFQGFRLSDIHTERFWHIREINQSTPRPYDLVYPEVSEQAARLERLANELTETEKRFGGVTGPVVVPDTNVFLHFKRFDQIDWAAVVGGSPVRVVIPLRVVEELDLKKASRRRDLARRAQNVLTLLESLVGPTAGFPANLSTTATVEVLINHELEAVQHDREPSADAEILDCCEFLAFVTGAPVSLATGDVSMRLRASVRGWPTVAMPDALRIEPDGESALVAQASSGRNP